MGYEVRDFVVEGMHCSGCVRSVTRAVAQMPGIKSVNVALDKRLATVQYDRAAVNPADIVAAIIGAGYGSRPK